MTPRQWLRSLLEQDDRLPDSWRPVKGTFAGADGVMEGRAEPDRVYEIPPERVMAPTPSSSQSGGVIPMRRVGGA